MDRDIREEKGVKVVLDPIKNVKNESYENTKAVKLSGKNKAYICQATGSKSFIIRYGNFNVWVDGKNHWTTQAHVNEAMTKLKDVLFPPKEDK